LRRRAFQREAVNAIVGLVTAGLHPELPMIGGERGWKTRLALLSRKRADIGRAAAINVKALDGHPGILGKY
jgi:hypothetical protein